MPWKQESENDDIDKRVDEKFYKLVERYNVSSPEWLVENEIDTKDGIYVNILKNPLTFTGYQGQQIWNAIYHENCFSRRMDLICTEERVFYKVISGLLSNINIYLCKNFQDLEKNITFFNSSMLDERVLNHNDRVDNLFFLHSILINAFFKAWKIIERFEIYTGNKTEDIQTRNLLDNLLGMKKLENYYSEGIKDSENIKKFFNSDKLDQIKMRFRNISKIMDCVSCQKCKLYGKLQIYGFATVLKILFSDGDNLKLKRNELISFINVVGKNIYCD